MIKRGLAFTLVLILCISCTPIQQVKAALDSNTLIQLGTDSYQITVTKDMTISQISSILGQPKLTTKSAFGGNAYTFYTDSTYSNYLYIETLADGKIISYGSVDPSYKTSKYSYNDSYPYTLNTNLGGCLYSNGGVIKGGIYYNTIGRYYNEIEQIKELYKQNFEKNFELYLKSIAQQGVIMYNALSANTGNPTNLVFDEEVFNYNQELKRKNIDFRKLSGSLDKYILPLRTNENIEIITRSNFVINPMLFADMCKDTKNSWIENKNIAVFDYNKDTKILSGLTVSEDIKNAFKSNSLAELMVDEDIVITEKNVLYAMSLLDDKMTEAEKGQILGQYIEEGTRYSFEYIGGSYKGMFRDHAGVCEDYADTYKLLLNRAGITCEQVSSRQGDHAWNICYIDGKWTYVDTTKSMVKSDPLSEIFFDGYKTKSYLANLSNHYHFEDAISRNKILDELPEGEEIKTPYYVSRVYYDQEYKYYIKQDLLAEKNNGLYKENRATGDKKIIAKPMIRNMYAGYGNLVKNGSKLYFVGKDQKTIYSINTDGTGEKLEYELTASDEEMSGIYVLDGYMWYVIYNSSDKSRKSIQFMPIDNASILKTYTFNDNVHKYKLKYIENLNEVAIVQCIGIGNELPQGEIYIPDTINGKPVVGIGEKCFSRSLMFLTGNIILPQNLKYIGRQAFDNCTQIKTIQFNEKLKSIGVGAFRNNKEVTNINLPDSVTYVEMAAFAGNQNLTKVNIGKGLKFVLDSTFANCTKLETITFPETVVTISESALKENIEMKDVIIKSEKIERMGFTNTDINIYLYGGTDTSKYADKNNISYIDLRSLNPIITIDKESIDIKVGDEPVLLEYKISPTEVFESLPVTITSSNPSIATVDNTGKITPISVGTTTITIKVGETTKQCVVTVNEKLQLLLDKHQYQINNLTERPELVATLSDGTTPNVTWRSSNENIATVLNGVITPKRGGFTYIIAKDVENNLTSRCWLYVCTLVTLSDGSKAYVGDINRDGKINDKDATRVLNINKYGSVTKDEILLGDVNNDGKVNATDNAVIMDIYKYNFFRPGTYKPITEVKLDKTNVTIDGKDKTIILKATYLPEDTTDSTNVIWTSNNELIATVNNGKVTSVSKGIATITATVGDKTASCTVTVKNSEVVKPEEPTLEEPGKPTPTPEEPEKPKPEEPEKPVPEQPELKYTLGDVNNDGKVNTLDAVKILQYVARKTTFTETQMLAANTNKDGKVNTLDAVKILQYIAKKITKF